MMEDFTQYILPELMVCVPVLYILGYFVKQSEIMDSKYIPLLLVVVGIALALCYEFGIAQKDFGFESAFISICQGILVAGAAVLINQTWKQLFVKE